MSNTTFEQFGLDAALLTAISDLGFEAPTPIQAEAIPVLCAGRDVIGGARTGSGKTAAFGLPLLQKVRDGGAVRALILAPTRELALQVSAAIASFARKLSLDVLTIYGGAAYPPQLRGLQRGATVVVGTPGRVIDLMERGALKLDAVEMFVLDEADEMLRMGFIEDVETILGALPQPRQIAMFSATMPTEIRRLAQTYLDNPAQIQVEEEALTVDHIEQSFVRVNDRDKPQALLRLLAASPPGSTLVFARTRSRCAEVAEALIAAGISADALHGDLNQGARERVLARLRAGSLDVVVATDVAARGIDVEHLSCVVNYDIPDDAETYVHRIGRTGRAGRAGAAITLVAPRDRGKAKYIQRNLGTSIADASLPTDAQIADARLIELLESVADAIETTDAADVARFTKVVESHNWPLDLVATALYRMLDGERNFELGAAPVTSDSRDFSSVNEFEIVVLAGRRDGVRPADIVGTLANDVGIPSSQIGKISLGSNRAFVGLPRSVGEALLQTHHAIDIRGKMIQIKANSSNATPPAAKPTATAAAAAAAPHENRAARRARMATTATPRHKSGKPSSGKPTSGKSKSGKRDKAKGAPGRHRKKRDQTDK